MINLFGIVIILGMVFGGYIASGGKLDILLHALPYEGTIIGGAALGAFIVGNDIKTLKSSLGGFKKIITGPRWKKKNYIQILSLLFELIKLQRQNPMSVEEHIENPDNSDIFKRYKEILNDHEAVDLICDALRSASMNFDDPHQYGDLLEKELQESLHHSMVKVHALQVTADALPALGIVAAVLGVIKTMSSIDQPPEILGKLIAGALVGTFLGVFLSYCLVGPLAIRMKQIEEEDHKFYQLIREVIVAFLHKNQPRNCIEVGRKNIPHEIRPSFNEIELALKENKSTT